MRSDENFDLFWEKVLKTFADFEVEEPHLPRQRKVPKRYEVGIVEPEFPLSVVEHYHRIYYQALDVITTSIESRFEQPGYQTYCRP